MKNVRVLFTLGVPMSPSHPFTELKTDSLGLVRIPIPSPQPDKVFVPVNDNPYVPAKDRIASCNGWQEFQVAQIAQQGVVGEHGRCPETSAAIQSAKPVTGEITILAKTLSAIERFFRGMQT
jgi:hypothetical protein